MTDITELLIAAAAAAGERNYTLLMDAAWAIQDLRNEVKDLKQALEDERADFEANNEFCTKFHIHRENLEP